MKSTSSGSDSIGNASDQTIKAREGRGRPISSTVLDRLVTAGLTLLQHEDPTKLTIERVCQEASVSRATFYRRWTSINPVIAAMAQKLIGNDPFWDLPPSDVRQALSAAFQNLRTLLSDPRVAALFRFIFSRSGYDEELRALVQELDRQRNDAFIDYLARMRANGLLREDFRIDLLSHQLFGPVWHRALLLQLPVDDDFIDLLIDSALRFVTPPT